ncbi:hypothetical protein AVL62_00010 [Serinicoccus chungangensis]|uniref:Uncharacterized protein n=1 Tax=Serinicoccus chungangensis TaxID=767452 RepID=A0A0W8I4Q9_9MICO|nr:hypothetical protein AVL62_00010 [Serinicoccus chungangensis]
MLRKVGFQSSQVDTEGGKEISGYIAFLLARTESQRIGDQGRHGKPLRGLPTSCRFAGCRA